MSTSTGTLDSSITFFPYGLIRTGSVSTDKKFTGQRLDGTGLYYYGARYYDASIGRFISPDSTGQKLTDPQSLNRYTYCSNNPLKYTDPNGHDQIITTGGVDDNGETWYTICDGQGNLLAIATGIDDLAQKMNDCDAVSRNVDLPLGGRAREFFDTVAEEKPSQVFLDTLGRINTAPNTILGIGLGLLSGGTPSLGPRGTILFNGIDSNSFTGKFMSNIHGNPVTFGYVILNKDSTMGYDTLTHELGHVTQYGILGPLFLPLYGLDSLRAGGDWNNKWMEGPLLPRWPRR